MITKIESGECDIEIHEGIMQVLMEIKLYNCRTSTYQSQMTVPWFVTIEIEQAIRKVIE